MSSTDDLTKGTTLTSIDCSYCSRPAIYMGDDEDGDSYCQEHTRFAPGSVHTLED